jgi:hypothetical protein
MLREHSWSRKAFSAIFVYVTTAGAVYTEQKHKKWGREKNLKFSCRLEACWLKFEQNKSDCPLKVTCRQPSVQGATEFLCPLN